MPDAAHKRRVEQSEIEMPMNARATKYLIVESAMSGLVNGILNYAAAYGIFHGHNTTPNSGRGGLIQDSIGETFLVISLSMLVPWLIARHRRRTGVLPACEGIPPRPRGNLYLRSFAAGAICTCVLVPLNALLLPRMFPDGVSFRNVLLFKTVYGTVLGLIATFVALRTALREAE